MRTCLIDIPGLSSRLLKQLSGLATPPWFDALMDRGTSIIDPVLPAVTMTAQATYSTATLPQTHGMIANGLPAFRLPDIHHDLDLSNYPDYRANVSFWEQSNRLVTAPRVWQADGRSVAMLFVQSSMGGAADVVVTPKPAHLPDGRTVSSCWTNPADLYTRLEKQLGTFPLHHYWGPMAGMRSSEWIIAAGRLVWEWHPTDLMWLYVPQMDYDLQRLGPGDERCVASLLNVLGLLTPLVERVMADGGRVLVISEYGMTAVDRFAAPNLLLAERGLLETNRAGEVDFGRSRAFAMCDHQVAHVYCRDDAATDQAEQLLREMEAVAHIFRGQDRADAGLLSPRAGDIVAVSQEDAWFEYRWWDEWSAAPEYAWTVDIHRKPGYDPTELFADPKTRRILADKPELVKGSHGARPVNRLDWPVLLGLEDSPEILPAVKVGQII
jgi:predicted AlkP superfamily pyrophosphatase or phosphodiesterase